MVLDTVANDFIKNQSDFKRPLRFILRLEFCCVKKRQKASREQRVAGIGAQGKAIWGTLAKKLEAAAQCCLLVVHPSPL